MSRQPHFYHQDVCCRVWSKFQQWSEQSDDGRPSFAPGLIFADDDDVAPDVVWMSSRRLSQILGPDGKLHAAPELIVEVLSPGVANVKRDREAKLKLYSRRGVDEYWIVDWQQRRVDLFRRKDAVLVLAATLEETDVVTTPLLAGFQCPVEHLFASIPRSASPES